MGLGWKDICIDVGKVWVGENMCGRWGWSVEISKLKMILGENVRGGGFREYGQVCSGYLFTNTQRISLTD